MRPGIVSCGPETSLAEIARIMATRRVHAVAVRDATSSQPRSLVSDRDLIAASVVGDSASAKNVATRAAFFIASDRSVAEAARVMSTAGVSRLIVFSASGDYPVGVLSTGDVIAAYAVAASDPQRRLTPTGSKLTYPPSKLAAPGRNNARIGDSGAGPRMILIGYDGSEDPPKRRSNGAERSLQASRR